MASFPFVREWWRQDDISILDNQSHVVMHGQSGIMKKFSNPNTSGYISRGRTTFTA